MNEIEILKRKLKDLSVSSDNRNIWEYSKFLNTAEQSELLKMKDIHNYTFFGGYNGAERCIAVFGNEEYIGYKFFSPIVFVEIKPLNDKFADNLTHRDFLGALMSLGINRDMLGDILVKSNSAVVVCIDTVSEYIVNELNRIRHTSVKAEITNTVPDAVLLEFTQEEYIVSSERIDVIISGIYNLSRNESQHYIKGEKVFIDSRLVESTSAIPKTGQVISVRGNGRFIYNGVIRTTKKNRFVISVKRYI